MIKVFVVVAVTAGLFGTSRPPPASDAPPSSVRTDDLNALEALAEKHHTLLIAPVFESTPEEIQKTVDGAIASANREYDAIGKLTAGQVTFANAIEALDDIDARIEQVVGRINVLQEAHPDPAMREAAFDAVQKLQEWSVGLDYRRDVYQAVKAFAATNAELAGEDQRLFNDTLRDYKRAGLDLPETKRADVEKWRKELGLLENTFAVNINGASAPVPLTGEELAGLPEDVLRRLKRRNDRYIADANVAFEYEAVEDNATPEATRKKLYLARDNRARAQNLPLLVRILQHRSDIAHTLGYDSWADYRIEDRMAKNGATALHFLENLKDRLEPKFRAELDQFKRIKAATPGQDTSDVNIWDWRFCAEKLHQQQFHVDAESLRGFFPLERVLTGMFGVYERIFGIEIREVKAPSKYANDLRLFAVIDRKTQEPLGLLYMDLFPRPGKFNHFANFPLVWGKLLPDGVYVRPTTNLLCNFPPPDQNGLALMSHDDVVTIFHEFGHAMHSILTQAKNIRFSGTNVPTDFVEAPSQMLEYFAWDKNVLDGFAADYRDPARKIPAETLSELKRADLATKATFYRRQLAFGILDLRLHSNPAPEQLAHLNDFCNGILGQVFLPPDPGTAAVASYGHLVGYDAGYYGYAWADVIAADMASVFEDAPGGYLDEKVGSRLRNEVYARGNSRDITVSIEKFLGRHPSVEPFLKKLGLQ